MLTMSAEFNIDRIKGIRPLSRENVIYAMTREAHVSCELRDRQIDRESLSLAENIAP